MILEGYKELKYDLIVGLLKSKKINFLEILTYISENESLFSDELIGKALDSGCLDLSLSPKTYHIEKVKDNNVIYYCLKDIKTFDKTDWYDRIIPSNILFNIKW